MRKTLLLLCIALLFLFTDLSAQTFTNNTVTNIPDENSVIEYPFTVSGLPTAINAGFGLAGICLDLDHPFIGQLTIVLKAPTGTDSVRLLWHDGGNSSVNSTICLTEAAFQFIAAYSPTGFPDYYGEEDNNIMNNGRNPNGVWTLRIIDVVPGSVGSINSASITFQTNPPPTHSRDFGCSMSTPWGCQCPDGTNDCDLLPDMTNAQKALSDDIYESAGEIRFSVATPNIGAGPLEMNGSFSECFCDETPVPCGTVCPAGEELKHNVYQKVYRRSGNSMTTSTRLAGQMELHPAHNHIHVDHWTNNTLRIKTTDPNPTHWPIIGESSKISFCLINLGSCDSYPQYCKDNQGNVLHNSDFPNYNFGVVSGCGLGQGIYPGRVDEYSAGLEGQFIDVAGLCNGTYFLVSITDPLNAVLEIDETNNWSTVPVQLSQQLANCCKTGFYADTLHGIDSLLVKFTDSTVAIPNQWHWDFGDGYTSTEQFPQHKYTVPGVYTVKLVTESSNACKDSLTRTAYVTITKSPDPVTPITEISVTVGPNPFKDNLVIRFSTPADMNTSIVVYDAIGRKMHAEEAVVPAGISSINLSSPQIGPSGGLYFVKIKGGSYSKVFKVLKQ